jgi:uncharacterized protein
MVRKIPDLPLAEIAGACCAHDVARLEVFGSVLRSDFRRTSDVDFLVTFVDDDCGPWMGRLTRLAETLEVVVGRPVDVVERKSIEASRNWIRRDEILGSTVVVYESR